MKHWSASKSYEYCSAGKTSTLSACGAARNCPESNEFADSSNTSSLNISMIPEIPDAFCEAEHNRRASLNAHRKTPASAGLRTVGYKWPAAF